MRLFREGDTGAANQLVEIFYPELRRLANARMRREPQGHSWQPTLLVNEFYLELVKIKALPAPQADANGESKSAFFGLAASLMTRLLVHHARPLAAKAVKVELDDFAISPGAHSVAAIEIALSRLQAIRPRLRAIVELKVFEGLTLQQIADNLQCSRITVAREWKFAQLWLQTELQP